MFEIIKRKSSFFIPFIIIIPTRNDAKTERGWRRTRALSDDATVPLLRRSRLPSADCLGSAQVVVAGVFIADCGVRLFAL